MFPPPAWEATWVERSENRAAFDVTRCYILDSLRVLNAGPVAAAFCAFDAALHEGMCPQLRFSRSGALAMGADRCDFCIEIVDFKALAEATVPVPA
jgi:hypothetical protein